MTEDQLQEKCFQWAWNTYPQTRRLLWAVPNGGSRHLYEAQKFKATGVIAGVHDLHLLWNHQFYTFELKVGTNTMSEAQILYARAIEQQGGVWYEIRNLETFKTIFSNLVEP